MGKIKETRELYNQVINEISKSVENWLDFLDSSSWNFKYDFDDQILIYAQRPDAKACATMEEWNKKLKRWVNAGTKPIYVFDKNPYSEYPFKLVFDLSDTHNYNNTEYKLWSIKKEYEQNIIEDLEASFGEIDSKESLAQAITLVSYNMVIDNMEDYLSSISNYKKNTILKDKSDDEIKNIFLVSAWASVSYMMMTRCGINAREHIDKQEFTFIELFNNQELLTILGTSISDIAEMGLREIAKTVASLQKSEKLKNRTIENINKEIYSDDNKIVKGGNEDDRENNLYKTRRILYAESNNEERENSSREVRSNEVQLSNESQKTRVDNSDNESEINRTFNTNTRRSQSESREDNRANETTRRNNRGNESQRPNEMDRTYEQHKDDSRRDSSERINLHLEETKRKILSKEEQKSELDFLQDKYVSALFSNIENLKVTKSEIKEFYNTHLSIEERAKYIKQAFNDAYTEIVVNDTRLGYKAYENVLHLWKDNYLNRTTEVYYQWETVADYIEGLILVNEFNDLHKQVPSYNDQMQILQVEAENAPTFSFTQEIIDYALQGGGNIQESKMRIYRQFEQSLSSQENIKFLKDEYGWGGSSSIHIGTGVGIDFNGKGIKLYRGYGENAPEILLPWNKVEKRISELIKLDRYLNPKEKEEYSNWLKKQEQEEELRKAEEKIENQAEQQEYELAKRVYSFVKPFDLYNYTDDTRALNTDEENIEIVKADINDTRNITDYVNALKEIKNNTENNNLQRQEIDELLSILEDRIPHYEYHLGDKVYIGSDEYEIASIKDNIVTLYNPKFPIFNEQMNIDEFERKVKDNFANDHLRVENKKENSIQEEQQIVQESVKESEIEESNKDRIEITTEKALDDKPYKVGQEVYLESDRKYRITKIDLEQEKIELQDLSINYPIFREESILTFENLYNQNERNFNKEEIKPNFIRTSNKIQDFILHPEVPLEDRNNYRIKDNNLGVGTPREKFERNIKAIKVLKKCENEDRYATPEEQEILSKYVGWGGLQQAFDENNASWSEEYKTLKELLNDEEYKNARSSVLTAFYTPPIVINSIYEILQNMGLKEANILEPSCGIGNFFGMLPTELERCKMYGVELDSISGRIAGQLYQKSTIAVNAYERVELPDSFFDVAVGNVPFDEYKPNDKRYNKNKFLTHDYFFAKTLDKVRPRRSNCFYYLKRNNGQEKFRG